MVPRVRPQVCSVAFYDPVLGDVEPLEFEEDPVDVGDVEPVEEPLLFAVDELDAPEDALPPPALSPKPWAWAGSKTTCRAMGPVKLAVPLLPAVCPLGLPEADVPPPLVAVLLDPEVPGPGLVAFAPEPFEPSPDPEPAPPLALAGGVHSVTTTEAPTKSSAKSAPVTPTNCVCAVTVTESGADPSLG